MTAPPPPPPTPAVGLPETRHHPRWLERHWRPAILLALLALALVGGYAIQASYHQTLEHLHTSQLEACERGNILRERLQVNVRVLDQLLGEAARNRRIVARHQENPRLAAADLAATTYRRLRALTVAVPTVDCGEVVPRP